MPTSYPGSLDTFTNPLTTDKLNSPSHADQHADANDAIEALETNLIGSNNVTTFTPTIGGGGSATFSERSGRYYQVGKLVFISFWFKVNAAGSGTSNVSVSGGPNIDRSQRQVLPGDTVRGSFPQGISLLSLTSGSGNTWDRIRMSHTNANITGSDLLNGYEFAFSGVYEAD